MQSAGPTMGSTCLFRPAKSGKNATDGVVFGLLFFQRHPREPWRPHTYPSHHRQPPTARPPTNSNINHNLFMIIAYRHRRRRRQIDGARPPIAILFEEIDDDGIASFSKLFITTTLNSRHTSALGSCLSPPYMKHVCRQRCSIQFCRSVDSSRVELLLHTSHTFIYIINSTVVTWFLSSSR